MRLGGVQILSQHSLAVARRPSCLRLARAGAGVAEAACPGMGVADGELWAGIEERYDAAQAAQASSMTGTSSQVVEDCGVRFVLKVAATLRDKPKAPAAAGSQPKQWRNPFLPPDPALFVRHLSPTHSLVLNKFNIVAHHVLVITQEFERQEDPLNAADLAAAWAVMRCMPSGGLAYFNRGSLSGASQPHKHVQVVPLPLLPPPDSPTEDPPFWPTLAADLRSAAAWQDVVVPPALPFVSFVARLDPETASGEALCATYTRLLQHTAEFLSSRGRQADAAAGLARLAHGEEASYNLLMTQHFMMLVPRRQESDGPVSCNAMAFAGSFFVRSTDELAHVQREGPMHVLATVGWPHLRG